MRKFFNDPVIIVFVILSIYLGSLAIFEAGNVKYKVKELTGETAGRLFIISMPRGYEPGDTVRHGMKPVVVVKVVNEQK